MENLFFGHRHLIVRKGDLPATFGTYERFLLESGHLPGVLSGTVPGRTRAHTKARKVVEGFMAGYGVKSAATPLITGRPLVWVDARTGELVELFIR